MCKEFDLYSPLSPIAPIQITIADGFGDVVALHFLAAFEVGDGAGNFQDAAVGTGGEFEALHCHAQHVHRGGIGLCKLVEHAFGHLGIAVDASPLPTSPLGQVTEAFSLYVAGTDNTLTNLFRRFAWLHLRQFRERNCLKFAMDIDAVKQRTADFIHILLYVDRKTNTFFCWMVVVSARTRVHASYQHEIGGEFNGYLRS